MKFLVVCLLGLLVAWPVAAQESWQITTFHSDIEVATSGIVTVHETITADFGTSKKHGIYRDLPVRYSAANGQITYTRIQLQTVRRNGNTEPYQTTTSGANIRITIGDPNKEITGQQVYDITYTVAGVLRQLDAYDELYWNVTGLNWEVPIKEASATVVIKQAPIKQAACYVGPAGSIEPCSLHQSATSVAFTASKILPPHEGLTVAVGYDKGIIPVISVERPPAISDVFQNPRTWLIAGLVMLLGLGVTIERWWQLGRSIRLVRSTIVAEYEPPGGLKPGEMGVLLDEVADTSDVTATIVDLAIHGYLTIKELPKTWFFGQVDYELTRTDKPASELREYEEQLLQHLFKKDTTIRLSELQRSFYKDLLAIKKLIYQEVVRQGLFQQSPSVVRRRYRMNALVVSVIGGGCLIIGGVSLSSFLVGLGLGTIISGLGLLITAQFMPRRTQKGQELWRQVQGYKLFVSGTEKYRQPFFEKENIFMEVLPYAMIFGVTEKLVNAFKDMGIEPPQPTWYTGLHPWQPILFVQNVEHFSAALSHAMASTPSGSGSGGGGWSGGGFGGGGGGSW